MADDLQTRIVAAWPDMLAGIAAGELVMTVLAQHGFTRKQVSRYILGNAIARKEWDEARETSADAFMDEAMTEARRDVDRELAQHVRTRIDTLKWAARIRNPRLYSDKSQVDVNVKTVDLTAIIRDAQARLEARNNRVIDVTPNNCESLPAHAYANDMAADVVKALDPALLALL
jgi:nitrogen fixation protein FixH